MTRKCLNCKELQLSGCPTSRKHSLSQSTRLTDRRTEFSSLDRLCISCSAVNINGTWWVSGHPLLITVPFLKRTYFQFACCFSWTGCFSAVLASFLKIYFGPIWRNVHFPVVWTIEVVRQQNRRHSCHKSTLSHTVCNALKCIWECLDFQILWGNPAPFRCPFQMDYTPVLVKS